MSKGMVVAPQPEAVEAGALALKRGGNAVDAAITCALVQTVVDPQMCGIAGFGSMQLYLPGSGVHQFIDFHGQAPLAATPEMWTDLVEGESREGFGFYLKGRVNEIGYRAITAPGSLKAFGEAVASHGTMQWADVVAPAIAWADSGFQVRPAMHKFWAETRLGAVENEEKLRFSKTGRAFYFRPDGSLLRPGDQLRNPDMAEVLRRVARDGPDLLYTGALAREVAADMAANGALLTAADLENYRTTHCEPLFGDYRGFRVATNPPPGGGVMLVEMMNILECFDLAAMGHNGAEHIRHLAEVMKWATIDKDGKVGDPAFTDVPLAELTDKDYAAGLAERVRAGELARVARLADIVNESPDTTHVGVVDAAGNAVTMTHSLGAPSGVITDGLGFMYNGCMSVFDPRPGRPGSIAPGKSRFSAICPTIVFERDRPRIVIGAPGATHITMAVLQCILNVLDFGMTMEESVAAPRISVTSDSIDVVNRIPRFITDELEALGYPVRRAYFSHGFAGVHGIEIVDGQPRGGADPGRDGMALAV